MTGFHNNASSSVVMFQKLTKIYDEKIAVKSLSAEIPKGCFGLLGPNGAGKTTTMLMLFGIVKPSSGTASMMGYDILKDSLKARQRVGFLPENVGFYPGMTGLEHLELMRGFKGGKGESSEYLLSWVGLDENFWRQKVRKYSQGMKQRLGIAQAFVGEPELVILDEPLSSLDPLGRNDMMKKISEKVRKGTSVILSSHVTLEVEKMANHIGIIHDGQMMILGSLNEIAKQHGFIDFEIDISADNILDLFETIKSVELPLIETPHIVGGKICVKTKKPEVIEEYLEALSMPVRLHPISGALADVYIKEVGGF